MFKWVGDTLKTLRLLKVCIKKECDLEHFNNIQDFFSLLLMHHGPIIVKAQLAVIQQEFPQILLAAYIPFAGLHSSSFPYLAPSSHRIM